MSDDRAPEESFISEEFARRYHDYVFNILQEDPNYTAWTWKQIPAANKNALIEAARRMIVDGYGKR